MFPLSPSSDDKIVNPMYVPVGAASPLWFMFAGSALAGMAFWWMSRWPALYTNLEVKLAQATDDAPSLPVPAPAPEVPAVIQEAAVETVAVAEKLAEPAAEAATVVTDAIAEATDAVPKPKAAKKTPPADDLPLTH